MKAYLFFSLFTSAFLFPLQSGAIGLGTSLEDRVSSSPAICRATVIETRCFKKFDGHIYTATGFWVLESIRGIFADTVEIEALGGEVGGEGETYCGQSVFETNKEYLLLLRTRDDGSLYADRFGESDADYATALMLARQYSAAGIDVTAHTVDLRQPMNVLPGSSSAYTSRFTHGDRDEAIEYVVDIDYYPSGITYGQALDAVHKAFAAWSKVTSLSFKFAGTESFGKAALNLNRKDGRIYVQLHDRYNSIPSDLIGRGGRSYRYNPGWGLGGNVAGKECDLTTQGYLIVDETYAGFIGNAVKLEEVVCHEIGHALSLAHSSENPDEGDALLRNAIMYYRVQPGSPGASLNPWDIDIVDTVYPVGNTPPMGGIELTMRALFCPGTTPVSQAPLSSGVNQFKIAGNFDRQGSAFPSITWSTANNGTFSIQPGNILFYTPFTLNVAPGDYYGPDLGFDYFDAAVVRLSDGINLSPPISVYVKYLLADYAPKNQIQDSWANANNVTSRTADYDNDGFNNLEEWYLGTNPRDASSKLVFGLSGHTVAWNANPGILYEVKSATNLADGFADAYPAASQTTAGTHNFGAAQSRFYKVQRCK
jgi:hypothetical protein